MDCWELLSYIRPSYHALENFKALELCVKSLKEGQNRVCYPSLRELPIKCVLVCRVLECILKVGVKLWELFFPLLKI